MRVIRVVDDERTTKTIAVLSRVVGVVPVSTRLVLVELVRESVRYTVVSITKNMYIIMSQTRSNGALVDSLRAISPRGARLEDSGRRSAF